MLNLFCSPLIASFTQLVNRYDDYQDEKKWITLNARVRIVLVYNSTTPYILKSHAMSSVKMKVLNRNANFRGIAEIQGTADRNTVPELSIPEYNTTITKGNGTAYSGRKEGWVGIYNIPGQANVERTLDLSHSGRRTTSIRAWWDLSDMIDFVQDFFDPWAWGYGDSIDSQHVIGGYVNTDDGYDDPN